MMTYFHLETSGRFLGSPILLKFIKELRVRASPPYKVELENLSVRLQV